MHVSSTPSQRTSEVVLWARGRDLAPSSERSDLTRSARRASAGISHELPAGTAVRETPNGASARPRDSVIRVAVVDDHAAIRIGLKAAIGTERGLVCVGAAGEGVEIGPLLYRTRPDVVVLDYHLPPANGLALCHQIKSDVPAPAVVLYSAYAGPALLVPALVAGADALVHKAAPPCELFEAIRAVAGGGTHLPVLIPELLAAASANLEADDLPILGMLIARTPPRDIAATLRLADGELGTRVERMLARLHLSVAPRGERHNQAPLGESRDLRA
jgi:two-component system response regulator DevR